MVLNADMDSDTRNMKCIIFIRKILQIILLSLVCVLLLKLFDWISSRFKLNRVRESLLVSQ